MKRHQNGIKNSMTALAEDARSLVAATADATEEKIVEARQRVADTLEMAKDTYALVQKKAIAGARAADDAVRENPYRAIGVAFGVGTLLGILLARRR